MVRFRARRWASLAALVVVVAAGLFVHAVLPESAFSDIAGDALYAVAIYAGLVLLFPRTTAVAVGALAATWCVVVELFQLTGVPFALGAAFPPAALVFGSGFDARDLVVYAAAAAAAAAIDAMVGARAGIRTTSEGLDPS